MHTVKQWLEQLGLSQHAEVFAENDVDLEGLRSLSESDLEKLGISLGNRKRLLNAIARLDCSAPAAGATDGLPHQEPIHAEAERRQLTVCFCDLVGSTALAERLDPEELRDLMQAYQRACKEVIVRYDGHVAQYLGDGLMAYFGWPQAHEDDAPRAIHAGLEAVEAVSRLATTILLSARVGIHTGLVVVGETGKGDASVPKAAVGQTPNIAARLQALAEPGSVVISEHTRSLASGLFDYASLGMRTLKGVSNPVHVFRVMGVRAAGSRFEAIHRRTGLSPLVGREDEVALLLRRWQQARQGNGHVVLVEGEPGIGKSRLVQVLRERLIAEPHKSLRYQCSPYHVNSALYPVIAHIERAAGIVREDPSEQKLDRMQAVLAGGDEQRAEFAPLLAALLSLPTGRYPQLNLSAQKQKERTLEGLVEQVTALARHQPLLMIFEDAHWIDPTSQEALDLLVPRLQRLPVLLIVTHRPEYTPRWNEQAHVTILALSRLDSRRSAELVAGLTAGKALPAELQEQLLARTDGVPLFIEELTKSFLESGLLCEENDRYWLQAPLSTLAIPATLRDLLVARLDRLAAIREVAQIGACIGREFSPKLLGVVSPLKGARLHAALEQLTSTGLLIKRAAGPHVTYAFKHALVQDAAYDSLLRSKRTRVHGAIAEAIEAHFPATVDAEPELLARHYTEAGLAETAAAYWLKAAKRAVSRSAYREALAHIGAGDGQLQPLPASSERGLVKLQLQLLRATALQALKGMSAEDTGAAFAAARELADDLGEDTRQVFPALFGIYLFHTARGEHQVGLEVARQALRRAQQAEDPALLVLAHRMMGAPLHYRGELTEAVKHLEQVVCLYDPVRDGRSALVYGSDPKAASLSLLSQSLFTLGSPDRALVVAEEAVAQAQATSHAHSIAHTLAQLSGVRLLRREPDMALEQAERARILSERHAFATQYEVAKALCGAALIDLGEPEQGMVLIRESLRNGDLIGLGIARASKLRRLAAGAAATGKWEQAAEYFDQAFAEVDTSGERWYLAELHRCKGEFLLARDGTAVAGQAEACFLESLNVARSQAGKAWELRTSTNLARLWQRRGRIGDARSLLSPVYQWFTEGFETKDLQEAKALLNELGC